MSVAPQAQAPPADAAARERALDPSASFVVQAPAGSGKTELLVRRLLVLLATATRPEAVVAMTFTRKAAGEMRERLSAALREAASGVEPASDYDRERYHLARAVVERSQCEGWQLIENPGRLELVTIDSLCARLADRTPLLSRFGSRPDLVEDARPLYREAAHRVLARVGERGELGDAIRLALGRAELRSEGLAEQLVAMLGRREQWASAALDMGDPANADRLLKRAEQRFAEIMSERLAALDGALRESLPEGFAEHAARVARATCAQLQGEGKSCRWESLEDGTQLSAELSDVAAWQGLGELLLIKKGKVFAAGTMRKSVDKNLGVPSPGDLKEDFLNLLASLREHIDEDHPLLEGLRSINVSAFPLSPKFSEQGAEALRAFFRVLLAAHAELWQVFREQGQVDFSEVSVRAIQALGSSEQPGRLLEDLDRRIEHLLVDEFQDTNVLQCRLVESLAGGWQPDDGRTLFLVGDPMQSIYRFRKAEVGLFLQAMGDALFPSVQLEPLELTVNFRSECSIINWGNEVFARVMGSEHDAGRGVVAFSPSDARPGAGKGLPVELVAWSLGAADADESEEPAARDTPAPKAAELQAAEARGLAQLIHDELEPEARARKGKVAVLVRAKSHAAGLMTELRRLGAGFRAVGMDALANKPVVQDLRALARFVVHPADSLAGMSLLRGPLVGLSLEDLCLLVEPGVVDTDRARQEALRADDQAAGGSSRKGAAWPHYSSVAELLADDDATARMSADARTRAARARSVIDRSRRLLGRVPVARVVEAAWLELGGGLWADRTAMLDARCFLDLLADSEQGGSIDFDELDRRMKDLTAAADPDPAIAVEFYTMHKAKGLEWDTVVLPGLNRLPRKDDKSPVAWETEPDTGLMTIAAPQPERGCESPDDGKFALIDQREKMRGQADLLRVAYVAATRAEHRLLLSTPGLGYDKKGDLRTPPDSTLLGSLWPAVEDQYEERIVSMEDAAAGHTETVETLTRLRADFALPAAPLPVADSLRLRRPSETGKPIHAEAMTTDRSALQKGTVVHKWLERIGHDAMEGWDIERLEREKPRIRQALAAEGVLPDRLDTLTDEATAALDRALADEKGRWLLGRQEDDRYEWDLTMVAEVSGQSEITSASIDRSFVEDGVRWIVDYKTGRVPFDQVEFASLDKAAAREKYLAEKKEHYQDQLQAYGELLSHLEPDRPIKLALYFPEVERGLHEWDYEPS